jgi:hypothetical protein
MRSQTMIIACALALVPTAARADVPPDAIALFEQGIKDLQAGKTELACRELAASLAIYNDSGTQGALAECYTQLGKVASAWKLWKELADTAPADLRADAADNAAKLDPRLPRYVIQLPAGAPAGIAVAINGVAVADPRLPVPIPIDPGPFTVTASAPQFKTWTHGFKASEGQVTTAAVPQLEAAPQPVLPPPQAVTQAAPVTTADSKVRVVDVHEGKRRNRHLLGGVSAIAGVVAIGAGGYFGIVARRKWNDARAICGGEVDACPNAQTQSAAQLQIDDSRSAASLSTIGFAAGGAAIVLGARSCGSARRTPSTASSCGPRSIATPAGSRSPARSDRSTRLSTRLPSVSCGESRG